MTDLKESPDWTEKTCSISEIRHLLDTGHEVEVTSPDGWVGVNFFIDKGVYDEYSAMIRGKEIRCNADHLFETTLGWTSAEQLYAMQQLSGSKLHVLTDDGSYHPMDVVKTGKIIPIVDINVNHENHRYYTDGVSSHNTGVGKSLFMCHVAASALAQGKNVLYITLEMSEERIAERIDANLMNIQIDQLPSLSKGMFSDKVTRIAGTTVGKLIIKEYPTASAHTGHFRALLNELKLKKDVVPDVIFVDYLNICASSRMKGLGGSINTYSLIKAIAEELRGLAVEFNVPIFSATQTTRSGFSNTDLELTDTSESFGLPATADFMFALITTEELEKLGQMMVKQLKNRYNDPSANKRFIIGVDRSKMKLYDVEDKAQTLSKEATVRGGSKDFSDFTIQ